MMSLLKRSLSFVKQRDSIQFSRKSLLVLMVLIGLGFSATAAATWEITNSSSFCGNVCHLMQPQAISFRQSAHAEVDCTNCHLGVGLTPNMVGRKARELTQVYKNVAGHYETPLRIKHLRPARETCERCHWTKAFYDDKVKVIKHYNTDKDNSLVKIALIIKTGGGTSREGKGYGIHWHVENKVQYIATDQLKQNIPWVKVTYTTGRTVTYIKKGVDMTAAEIKNAPVRTMDCIDCHNRVSHDFRNPDQALDEVIGAGLIDSSIPWVKKNFLNVLQKSELNEQTLEEEITRLKDYYKDQYPLVSQTQLNRAFATLRRIYRENFNSDLEVDWRTYPNNLGHKEFPGCFRCHDGKHVAVEETGDPARKVIRKECNLCHSVPLKVSDRGNFAARVLKKAADPPQEPASHLVANWAERHGQEKDAGCLTCHEETTGGEFCSNTGCHGNRWDLPRVERFYAGKGIYCIQCHEITGAGAHGVQEHKFECISCHHQVTWKVTTETCKRCHVGVDHDQARQCWQCHNFRSERKKG